MAALLASSGNYSKAQSLYERGLAIYERVYGEEHPDTALVLNNLGALLVQQGSYDEAQTLHERALAIREKVLGPEHTDTAQSLNDLEAVMNFGSETVASGHGYEKTVPKRRFRRRVGLCRPIPGARSRRRPPTRARSAGGPQRIEVGGEDRLPVALHAPRPATVGGGLPADAAVAQGGSVRGDGSRSARALAPFEGQSIAAHSSHTRLSHPTLHPRERLSGRIRRSQAPDEGSKVHAAVDT
jgi:hypothetical protein